MIAVDQTQFAGDGAGGDCVRASVASLLEMPISQVPHFLEEADTPELWEIELIEWLEARGFTVWREEGHYQFDGYYLASGPAGRGVSHMVVYRNGQLVHDPHPSRAGLLEVKWSRMLVPLDPAAMPAPVGEQGVVRVTDEMVERALGGYDVEGVLTSADEYDADHRFRMRSALEASLSSPDTSEPDKCEGQLCYYQGCQRLDGCVLNARKGGA